MSEVIFILTLMTLSEIRRLIQLSSQKMFFGYKNDYIKERTKHLLEQLKGNRFHDKYGILMNFYGYKDINNVVSAFWHKEEFLLHQKSKLIPFFLRRKVFIIYQNHRHHLFYIMKRNIMNRISWISTILK